MDRDQGEWWLGRRRRLIRAGVTLGFIIASTWGCSKSKHKEVLDLDAQLSGRLGKANREDILALLGEPQIRDAIGESEMWIYQFKGANPERMSPTLKLVANTHDELIMTFDATGVLQNYHAVIAGSGSRKGRK